MASPLARWLATLDSDALTALLVRRPDAVAAPAPTDLSELAARLQDRAGVFAALRGLPLPAVQLIEVLQAFGAPSAGRDQLAVAVGRAPDDPDLDATLLVLAQRALVWPDGDELRMAGPLWSAFLHPLRLGAPARRLIDKLTLAELRGIATRLGLLTSGARDRVIETLTALLADGEAVRALLAGAPPPARALIEEAAWRGPLVFAPMRYTGDGRDLPEGAAWAVERGLLVADGWEHLQLPGEVGMALRGPDWRAPFDPRPPAVAETEAPRAAVDREAAAAAACAVGQLSAVLEECARTPVALLKTGGVGTREIRRLARAVGCGEPEVRLWLELAYAAGLAGIADGQLRATEAYDEWADCEPAARLAPVLRTWLRLPAIPLAGGVAALVREPVGLAAPDVRTDLLGALADLPDGRGAAGPATLAAALRWRAPLVGEPPEVGELQVDGAWREAHLLGAVAHGTLTPIGRALAGDDARHGRPESGAALAVRLMAACAELLPAAVEEAVFQADLTAVVPGLPAAPLAALLDDAAVRESGGGAITWRFTPESVRAAYDAGRTADGLLAELRAVAVGGALPQVLEYLATDVARRHGAVRVRSVGCVLRSDDPALLTEIAGARALRALRLTILAPTVLASARPVAETLAALRASGYAPTGEDGDGNAKVERAPSLRAPARPPALPQPRATAPVRAIAAADAEALAEALLAGPQELAEVIPLRLTGNGAGRGASVSSARGAAGRSRKGAAVIEVAPADDPAAAVRTHAAHLSAPERRLLTAAIAGGTPVRIDYTNAGGRTTSRVIEPVDLDRHLLVAWCHLRDEERMFALDRIDAVARA